MYKNLYIIIDITNFNIIEDVWDKQGALNFLQYVSILCFHFMNIYLKFPIQILGTHSLLSEWFEPSIIIWYVQTP